jgi:hypothetical protein
MVRRISFVLALFLIVMLFSFWAPLYGSSERVYTRAVLRKQEPFPNLPTRDSPTGGGSGTLR